MQYVVALADEQQFTRAAALTGVSQSGLSAAIRGLEEELGTVLFSRTSRRVEPTDAGRALLPHARSMLAQAAAARDAVVRATRELSGTLRVGAEQCLGLVDVSGLLERFHRRYPQVEVHFDQAGSHDLLARVRAGEIDVAFVATTEHLGALPATVLGSEPLVLLCAPGHPLAGRVQQHGGIGWDDLADVDVIDFSPAWGVRPLNDAACAAHGVRRRVRFTVGDVHTLIDLVDRGLGAALVPRHVAGKPQASRLRALPLPDGAPRWVVSAVSSPGGRGASAAPHLLEMLPVPAGQDTGVPSSTSTTHARPSVTSTPVATGA